MNDNQWLYYALATVFFWGLYGILLHTGQTKIVPADAGPDPVARYKAFLWVGVAYFLVAVIAPVWMIASKGTNWRMDSTGVWWSLIAGIAGAAGAFGVLLALGAAFPIMKGNAPNAVMSIVFAGAPIVNTVVTLIMHPPKAGWGAIKWPFYIGVIMAAVGAYLVVKFKPVDAPSPPAGGGGAPKAAATATPSGLPPGYLDVSQRKYEIS
jgi:hypothetical protein